MPYSSSQGITNEWDIIPICLGTIFESILRAHPETDLPAGLDHLDGIHLTSPDAKLDFETPVLHTGRLARAGMSPSEAIYHAGEGGPFPAYLAPGCSPACSLIHRTLRNRLTHKFSKTS